MKGELGMQMHNCELWGLSQKVQTNSTSKMDMSNKIRA